MRRGLIDTGIMLLLAFTLTTLILLAAGAPPLSAFRHLLGGSLGSWLKISRVLMGWIPLSLCACGLIYTFRMGLWNIGIEGQVVAGAVCAAAVLRLGDGTQLAWVVLPAAFLAGMAGGALWATLAGFLKVRAGVNEIFAGLGLNFVAQGITLWLIFGPWKRPGVASMSGTEMFPRELWLPSIAKLRLSPIGLLLACTVLALTAWAVSRTRLGLALRGIGCNPKGAFLQGVRPGRYALYAMALAGACAGLAGTFQVTGVYHRLIPAISSNYGYLALLVAMLANYRVAALPAIAFFFACLNVGSIQLPMMLHLDSSLSGIVQGTLVLAALVVYAWRKKNLEPSHG